MICADWITEAELIACETVDGATTAINERMITATSEILYALSGRQYSGSCTETVRPCAQGGALPGFAWSRWTYPWIAMKSGGTWLNIGPACGCHVSYDCACKGIPEVILGRSDVTEILKVDIAGVELTSDNWRLDHGSRLVRIDDDLWPCCQDLSEDIGATGTWFIELAHGIAPPQAGKNAATSLATEMVKACVGADCRLPQRVTNIVRQGVSMTLLDPLDFMSDGLTGIYDVDLFIKAVNPNGLARRATAWSPEVRGKGRRVGVIGS